MSGMTESVRRAWVTGCCALSGVDRSAFTEHEKLFDRSLASSGEYRIIDRFIHQDDLVFDVGANVGLWSHYVLQRKKVGALYAFEPTNEVAEQLKQHIAGPDNVYCMNMAVTDQDGRANLTCYACSSHNSVFQRPYSHAPEGDRGVRTVTSVPTVSLDSFCHKYDIQQINFLKIDTEGAEQLVLNGAKGLLRKNRIGIIQFKYNACWRMARVRLADVYYGLRSHGYSIARVSWRGISLLPEWQKSLETYSHANYLALAPDMLTRM